MERIYIIEDDAQVLIPTKKNSSAEWGRAFDMPWKEHGYLIWAEGIAEPGDAL